MVCKSCGKELSDQAKFCNRCGAPLTVAENVPQKKRRLPPFAIVLIVLGAVATFFVICGIVLLLAFGLFLAPKKHNPVEQTIEMTQPTQEFPTEATASDDYPFMEYISPIFSDSNQRYLTADDVERLSAVELLLARSEIYARHGVIFANSELAAYFEHQGWYVPSVAEDAFDKAAFNDQESANVQLIEVYEKIVNGGYAPASDNPYMPYYDPVTELLLPKSSTTELTTADLAGYNKDQLIIIRNQIIALHGYTFSDQELMEYFLQCSWYRPSTAPGRTDLVTGMTSLEYNNMTFIHEYEQNPQPAADPDDLNASMSYLVETSVFSVYLPEYWREYCVVDIHDDTVSFYEALTYNSEEASGFLFSIFLLDEGETLEYTDGTVIGKVTDKDGNVFELATGGPFDVPANTYLDLYIRMSRDKDAILATLRCKDGYTYTP